MSNGPIFIRETGVNGHPKALGFVLADAPDAPEHAALAYDTPADTVVVRARDPAALEALATWLDTFEGRDACERAAADVLAAVRDELGEYAIADGGLTTLKGVKLECPNCGATHVRRRRVDADDPPETIHATCIAPHPNRNADFEGCGEDRDLRVLEVRDGE